MKIPQWIKKILNCGYDTPVSDLKYEYKISSIMEPFQFMDYEIRSIREHDRLVFEVFDLLIDEKPMVLAGHIHRDGTRCWTYSRLRGQIDLFHKLSQYAQTQFKL